MYPMLNGLRIIEGASFIAAPYCGLTLQQYGAEVIRFDAIGGGPDFRRWPKSPEGDSFYWEGLNKGKKSIAINLSVPEGRELAAALVTAPGERAGIFVTNYPASGFLSHARLAERRPDLITARIMGWANGANAVDYTVNCAVGLPWMTGPREMPETPVNHVLPAWDLLAGLTAATAVLTAERFRSGGGGGQEIRVPLGDVAAATLGHLGQIAEVIVAGGDRPRGGNDLFGAFGRDFLTRDGERIMLVAITANQWSALLKALDLHEPVAALERELGVSFATDEGVRYEHRERLYPLFERAVARADLPDLAARFDAASASWGPYQTLHQAVTTDARFSSQNPVFGDVTHTSGYSYPTPGPAATFTGLARQPVTRAPRLGENTDEVLASVLSLPAAAIGKLRDGGIVDGR